MVEAKNETGLAITTEVKDLRTIEATLRAGFDALWVGSRNGQNFSLLDEVGIQTNGSDIPVVLKRTMSSSLEEWIGAAEYIARHNPNVILCERGIRGYSPDTRNILVICKRQY
jgi:3-deoxy-7-phosphoheptulonate synthase